MDDDFRNECVEKIATKIISEKISPIDPSPDVMDYLQKYAVSLGVDTSITEELVNESFFYLDLKNARDIDPLTKGDQFGAGFS